MVLKTIFKTLASLCILIGCILLFSAYNYWSTANILVLCGVICALVGDVLLSEFSKGISLIGLKEPHSVFVLDFN